MVNNGKNATFNGRPRQYKKYEGPGKPTHGLASTYRSEQYKCRCEECCDAHTQKHHEEQQERARRLAEDPTLAAHGKASTYSNWGCRCDPCTIAHSAKCADYQARRKARK